ncbi:hypothetical protein ACW0TA_11225, partial [Fusobacterium polymorphum]
HCAKNICMCCVESWSRLNTILRLIMLYKVVYEQCECIESIVIVGDHLGKAYLLLENVTMFEYLVVYDRD